MALHRFFLKRQVLARETAERFPLRLTDEDQRHAAVLRLRPGEHIAVIDGDGVYYECELITPGPAPTVRIAARITQPTARFSTALCIGLAKGSVVDDVVRAATELGVDAILPFIAARSVARPQGKRSFARTERWDTIARNAAMQSGRTRIPEVHAPCDLSGLGEQLSAFDGLLICWEEADASDTLDRALDTILPHPLTTAPTIGVVIGPEGGLTEQEVETLSAAQPHTASITLGPHILRVETAATSALSLLSYELSRRLERS